MLAILNCAEDCVSSVGEAEHRQHVKSLTVKCDFAAWASQSADDVDAVALQRHPPASLSIHLRGPAPKITLRRGKVFKSLSQEGVVDLRVQRV